MKVQRLLRFSASSCALVALSFTVSPLLAQMSERGSGTSFSNTAMAYASASDAGSDRLPDAPQPQQDTDASTVRHLPMHFLKDQEAIWTSPARLKRSDLKWLLPLAAATGVSLGTDHYTMQSVVSHNDSFNQRSVDASNVITGGLLAAPVALFGLGYLKSDEHAREAGFLGGEAVLDSLVVEQGLKLATWRERPLQDNGRGLFFQGNAGVNSSFPSSHSLLAWSAASVLASEYPSRWKQAGIYSLATGVSLTRVMGQQHFPTDVLIGSAAGWLVGRYVYRTHHRKDLR